MKKGLFSKMIATYTVIIAISFVITSAFLSYWFENYYFNQRKDQLLRAAQLVGPPVVSYLEGNIPIGRLNDALKYIEKYFTAEIILTDKYGYVYATSSDNDNKLINKQILSTDLEELRKGNSIEKRGTYGKLFSTPVHTYIVPITYNSMFEGAIMMNTSIAEINRPLKKVYEIIWISAIFAIIVPCFIIYYFSQRIIIKPLGEINYVARKITKGEVDKRVNIQSEDEIGELAKSFNSMADSLEKVEKNRREFISNVSHEIRTPITSIKGFIGGILDNVIPPEKERYYLSLASDEIGRLTRLVNGLLDLSAIEAGQLTLEITNIDINELIRRTVIKFETKIREKKLNVDVCFSQDDLYAAGDKDRITQVVINLFDNAIKYANDEGNIKVSTRTKGDKIYVTIYNDCEPMLEEDLKRIWDRFYKADKSRTSKISTGLGLPIVRSILTQHGEDIWVENNKDSGIQFTFTLKRVKS